MEIELKETELIYKVSGSDEVAKILVTSVGSQVENIYLFDHDSEILLHASDDTLAVLIEAIKRLT